MVAAETSIVRDGRHHASARQHVVAFATRVPRKSFGRCRMACRRPLTVNFGFREARKRTRGESAFLRVGRAGVGVGTRRAR